MAKRLLPKCDGCERRFKGKGHQIIIAENKLLYCSSCKPKQGPKYSNENRLKSYSISEVEYGELLSSQDFGCKICSRKIKPSEHKKVLSIDHNHITGKVRGLLCNTCNTGLGMFKDDPALLRQAAIYLEENNN